MGFQRQWMTILSFFSVTVFSFSHAWAQPFGLMNSQGKQVAQSKILYSENGRYVFGQISDAEKDQFMLDTQTGRLWRLVERGDIGKHLISVPYCNSKGECSPYPDNGSEKTALDANIKRK